VLLEFNQNETRSVAAAVTRFPGTRFALEDLSYGVFRSAVGSSPKNLIGSLWRVEEPAYLAGYLGALVERRKPGRHVIGSVGGYDIAPVRTFVAGYEAGARAADPGITLLRNFADDFFNPTKCRRVARSQIAAGAGVDVDQSFLGPHILTSVLKHWDVEVYDTVEALVRGRLLGGRDIVWDLANGAVGLGRISSSVPQPFLWDVDRLRARIVAGNIHVPSNPSR
jgi:basic membrane protein A and related proteins